MSDILMFDELTKGRQLNLEKLLAYGFQQEDHKYVWMTDGLLDEFVLIVYVDDQGHLDTKLVEEDTGEEYFLYKTHAVGDFIGTVRAAIKEQLSMIIDACYDQVFFAFPRRCVLSTMSIRLMAIPWNTYGRSFRKTPFGVVVTAPDGTV